MNKKELDKAGRKHREDLCDEYLGEPDRLPLLVFSDEKLFKRSQNKNKVYVRRRKGTAQLEKHINFYKPCSGNADCNLTLSLTKLRPSPSSSNFQLILIYFYLFPFSDKFASFTFELSNSTDPENHLHLT